MPLQNYYVFRSCYMDSTSNFILQHFFVTTKVQFSLLIIQFCTQVLNISRVSAFGQIANALTKSLSAAQFNDLKVKLKVVPFPHFQFEGGITEKGISDMALAAVIEKCKTGVAVAAATPTTRIGITQNI